MPHFSKLDPLSQVVPMLFADFEFHFIHFVQLTFIIYFLESNEGRISLERAKQISLVKASLILYHGFGFQISVHLFMVLLCLLSPSPTPSPFSSLSL